MRTEITCQFHKTMARSPMTSHSVGWMISGKAFGAAPGSRVMSPIFVSTWNEYEMKKLMPMAVIRAVSFGFSRSGR